MSWFRHRHWWRAGPVRLRIAPAGLPYYRVRLEFSGVYEPSAVRLSAAGQSWELR